MARKRKKRTKKRKKRIKKRKIKKRRRKVKKNLKKNQSKELLFKVPKKWSNNAYVDKTLYEKKYNLSIRDNDGFWKKEGKRINWIKPYPSCIFFSSILSQLS